MLTPVQKIYVTLDSLLDVRLGALSIINTDFAFEVVSDKRYFLRQEDVFETKTHGALSKEKLLSIIDQQGNKVIRNSLITNAYLFIKELCTKLTIQYLTGPHRCTIELDINTHPYNFTQAEQDTLLSLFQTKIGQEFTIHLIHKSDAELTAGFCRENYLCMVMYNYANWVNLHDTELKKKPLRNTGLYVPKLYFTRMPDKEEMKAFEENQLDIFQISAQILEPIVVVQYLPVALFSAATPENKFEYFTA